MFLFPTAPAIFLSSFILDHHAQLVTVFHWFPQQRGSCKWNAFKLILSFVTLPSTNMLGLFAILMLRDMLVSNVTFVYLLQKNLVNLVHHMGGAIRKDFSTKVTHLIAYSTHGEKYKVCKTPLTFPPIWKSSCISLIHMI